jgi:hypothetical protein
VFVKRSALFLPPGLSEPNGIALDSEIEVTRGSFIQEQIPHHAAHQGDAFSAMCCELA